MDISKNAVADIDSFRVYELTVNKRNITTNVASTVLQATDILRNGPAVSTTDNLFNLIYLEKISTISIRNTAMNLATDIMLFEMDSTFFLNTTYTDITDATIRSVIDDGYTYTNLKAGWYGVQFKYVGTLATDTPLGSASFQSNAYTCPYDPAFKDVRCAFNPCTGSTVVGAAGGPINVHQQYIIQAHGCGLTQFFNGTCNNVDPAKNCNTFNALSGDCTSCPSTKYNLTSGSCVIPPTCSSGSTLVGVVCVSDLCATSNADGTCATCKSVLNEVKADGSCGAKTCTAPKVLNQTTGNCDAAPNNCDPGYFEVGTDCYKLGPNCTSLSPFLTCETCDPGYKI